MVDTNSPVFLASGYCPTCDNEVDFVAHHSWFRDHLLCTSCGSIPRERALMAVIDQFLPKWREAVIHESSPAGRGASVRLAAECPQYIASQYFPGQSSGNHVQGMRCENLEALSFADQSIDLHVSQDVVEHLFNPSQAFREIARTLKPGGMHIFTVPLVNKERPSRRRARVENECIVHLEPEQYHGNPVADGRALVTVDWGFDICRYIHQACGLFSHLIQIDDLHRGIRAEYIEVLVSVKPQASNLQSAII